MRQDEIVAILKFCTHRRQVSPGDVGNRVHRDVLTFHKVGVKELELVVRLPGGV